MATELIGRSSLHWGFPLEEACTVGELSVIGWLLEPLPLEAPLSEPESAASEGLRLTSFTAGSSCWWCAMFVLG